MAKSLYTKKQEHPAAKAERERIIKVLRGAYFDIEKSIPKTELEFWRQGKRAGLVQAISFIQQSVIEMGETDE
jgi:hypothetical protein